MPYDSDIDQMIDDSIRNNETVVVRYKIDTQNWVWVLAGLIIRAENWTRITDGDSRLNDDVVEVREFWGADKDGDDWHIHVYSTRS